ncbi:MAG: hypothetical protein ACXAC5_12700 [Promethearchaeota archaeon]
MITSSYPVIALVGITNRIFISYDLPLHSRCLLTWERDPMLRRGFKRTASTNRAGEKDKILPLQGISIENS